MFAGSILDLEPDTAYEAQFVVVRSGWRDRPGAEDRRGPHPARTDAVRRADASSTSTRTASREQKIEPSFEGLMCAYNFWCAGTDWATTGRPRVRPGDTILVHAGLYKYNRFEYTNDPTVNRTVPLDGTYYLTADGTPEMPIAIKGAGDGEAIFDGNGNFALFDVKRRGLHLLRGADLPQQRGRDCRRDAVHRRVEGADGQALPVRERRRRRSSRTTQGRATSTSPTTASSAATIRST